VAVELRQALNAVKGQVDLHLVSYLEEKQIAQEVRDMLVYALLGEGKRLRPALCLWACLAVGGNPSWAMEAAAGVECIHAFSLVHDDLPGMDNSELRRGKLVVHRVFGVGEAILVGDALFALGMELIGRGVRTLDAAKVCRLLVEAARSTGVEGMIGGQFDDIRPRMDERKTARLFQLALHLGCALGGGGVAEEEALLRYGLHLGLAFQLEDDLLDLESETTPSWARQLGPEEARRGIARHGGEALAALAAVRGDTSLLEALVGDLAGRQE
jgi:geranylgeranyl diphosphate synthase type II